MIRRRDRDTIVQALRAGVVPKLGLQHIQVGRSREVKEIARDIEHVISGGATIRFIIGEYGSGKTFFLTLARQVAVQQGLVVVSADLAPDRRLYASGGQARALYAEMARNASTRSKPDGGALASVVERFASRARLSAEKAGTEPTEEIRQILRHLEEFTGGYDFATVIARFWHGFETGDEELKSSVLRWLRAEFSTKTDARKALGVRVIINDANFYDQLKLLAMFVREAGYKGLLVTLDEMVNLYKLPSARARQANYEQILRILNDVLQGSAGHIGFVFGGTPEFLMDTRRGLYSYEALKSRLSENTFARDGLVDTSGPVIRISNLTPEDMYVLLTKIRRIMLSDNYALPDEALTAFMRHCSARVGDAYFRMPRNTVKAFVNLLSVLEQNPGTNWSDLIGAVKLSKERRPSEGVTENDDELTSFKL